MKKIALFLFLLGILRPVLSWQTSYSSGSSSGGFFGGGGGYAGGSSGGSYSGGGYSGGGSASSGSAQKAGGSAQQQSKSSADEASKKPAASLSGQAKPMGSLSGGSHGGGSGGGHGGGGSGSSHGGGGSGGGGPGKGSGGGSGSGHGGGGPGRGSGGGQGMGGGPGRGSGGGQGISGGSGFGGGQGMGGGSGFGGNQGISGGSGFGGNQGMGGGSGLGGNQGMGGGPGRGSGGGQGISGGSRFGGGQGFSDDGDRTSGIGGSRNAEFADGDSDTSPATDNTSKQQVLSLEQNNMIKSALAQNTASEMPSDVARDFIGGDPKCKPSSSVEGNWGMVQHGLRKNCVRKIRQKERRTKQLAQKLMSGKSNTKECVKKLGLDSMVCQTRKVINHLVASPFYKVVLYGNNVLELIKGDKVETMAIAENLHYNVDKDVKKEPSSIMKNPTVVLEFNKLGSLLRQKGELPKPKKNDPCASCLDELAKKEAVEGQSESCGGCSSLMEITTIRPDSFKDVTKNKKKKDDDSDGKKKKSKNGNSSSDED